MFCFKFWSQFWLAGLKFFWPAGNLGLGLLNNFFSSLVEEISTKIRGLKFWRCYMLYQDIVLFRYDTSASQDSKFLKSWYQYPPQFSKMGNAGAHLPTFTGWGLGFIEVYVLAKGEYQVLYISSIFIVSNYRNFCLHSKIKVPNFLGASFGARKLLFLIFTIIFLWIKT